MFSQPDFPNHPKPQCSWFVVVIMWPIKRVGSKKYHVWLLNNWADPINDVLVTFSSNKYYPVSQIHLSKLVVDCDGGNVVNSQGNWFSMWRRICFLDVECPLRGRILVVYISKLSLVECLNWAHKHDKDLSHEQKGPGNDREPLADGFFCNFCERSISIGKHDMDILVFPSS